MEKSKFEIDVKNKKLKFLVCIGSGCKPFKSSDIVTNLKSEISSKGLNWEVKQTGCHGFCEAGPVVVIKPFDILYTNVTPDDAKEIISSFQKNKIIERLLYELNGEKLPRQKDLNFYAHQTKYLLRRTGEIDPYSFDDFIKRDGFEGLKKALDMKPEDVIKIVKDSGLRGRGGGGFSTGMKWSFIAKSSEKKKYIVANADEGDPGSFMDRTLLEGDPFAVIEGMLISAYAIGSNHGIIYVRAEYPQAVEILQNAIKECYKNNYLGIDVCGKKDFDFNIELSLGSGAFVCGEETALMSSVEGNRGIPKVKPPFPADRGIYGKPTNINNVKTYGYVSHILREGIDSFRKYGTEKSPGTAVLSLTGKINSTGIVEVPMGTSLKKLIYDIAGGMKNGKKLKGVLTGGPSGGVIPAHLLDVGIDYDSLSVVGSIMGSGGVLAFDEDDSMIETARFFIGFTKSESCGKCTPCREGTYRLYEILDKFMNGNGSYDDIIFLDNFCNYIKDSSACGLGQTAPNPVLTTLKYFRDEYESVIKQDKDNVTSHNPTSDIVEHSAQSDKSKKDNGAKESGNKVSKTAYKIDSSACTGCHACTSVCPVHCIKGEPNQKHKIDTSKCIACGSCHDVCKFGAISKINV